MGSGDLNLKKSWHPGLMRNQAAVWKREQEALAERKKIAERQKEIQRERERNELLAMQESVTGKKRVQRMEWMYSGVSGGGSLGATDEAEAYLLGKKRIDDIFEGQEKKEINNDALTDRFSSGLARSGAGGGAGGKDDVPVITRDLGTKVREDPMMAIKRKQMEAAIAQSQQGQQSQSQQFKQASLSSRSSESRHTSSRRRHEESSSSSRHSSSRRPYNDSRRSDDSRSRHREPGSRKNYHRDRSDNSDDEDEFGRQRERSQRRSSPRRSSPRRSSDHGHSRRRSRSPSSHSHSSSHYRSNSTTASRTISKSHGHGHSTTSSSSSSRDQTARHRLPHILNSRDTKVMADEEKERRQRKLDEMMEDAKKLEETRSSRLKESDQREEEYRIRDEADRKRSSKRSGGGRNAGDFVRTATRDLLSDKSSVEALRRGMV